MEIKSCYFRQASNVNSEPIDEMLNKEYGVLDHALWGLDDLFTPSLAPIFIKHPKHKRALMVFLLSALFVLI